MVFSRLLGEFARRQSFLTSAVAQQIAQIRQAIQALISLVQARANRYADTAALFQSLGGGWWNRADVASAATSSRSGHLSAKPASE